MANKNEPYVPKKYTMLSTTPYPTDKATKPKIPTRATLPASANKTPSRTAPSNRSNAPRGKSSARGKPSTARTKRNDVHRNVSIKQDDPAIWEHFRARTVQGTKIFIGKNTIIGPGVNIIAEKGTITIGDNNIISEGTLIINKSTEELIIGNGNVFQCGARIEASRINDYNCFGAKCHVMAGALIGTGCVICPRVMIIAKKRIRDCMVVFGDNMVHEQPLSRKRNRAYVDQMIPVLAKKFREVKHKKQVPSSATSKRGANASGRTQRRAPNSSGTNTKRVNFANKSREEKPVAAPPSTK